MDKQEIREQIEEEGAVHALVTLEVAGKPKQHVEQSLSQFIDYLKNEEQEAITVLDVHREDAVELEDEDGMFSAFAEVKVLVATLEAVTQIAINLTPASIEILEPDQFRFPALDLQNWINDLLSHLHRVAMDYRTTRQRLNHLNQNMLNLLQNTVTIVLANGPKTTEELARLTGVEEEPLTRALAQMEERGGIAEEDEKWILKSAGE